MTHPTLFELPDPPTPSEVGATLRDAAIDRVEANADTGWYELAFELGRAVAAASPTFTTDHVWSALESAGAPPPPEPRAMGAVLRRLKSERIAAPTDRTVLSERPACHRRPVRVWRSLA